MEITYPSEKGVIASFDIDTGYTSPFDIRQLKKAANSVKKAKNAIKKKRAAVKDNKATKEKVESYPV